jgi:hypothetical protein
MLEVVNVGAADAPVADLDLHLPRSRASIGEIFESKISNPVEDDSGHQATPGWEESPVAMEATLT